MAEQALKNTISIAIEDSTAIPGGIASSSKTNNPGIAFKDDNLGCCRLKYFVMMIQATLPQGSKVTSYFKARARNG